MFDTVMIGKKIKQARIDRNMTQMNLADAMGVSYQAVSNWERGNSMPDISKLGDLCEALQITVNELLGIESPAVAKAMVQEELTVEELVEVAPVLPPKTMQFNVQQMQSRLQAGLAKMSEKLEQTFGDGGTFETRMNKVVEEMDAGNVTVHIRAERKKGKKLDLGRIAELAPFLDEKDLDKLLENADLSDLDALEDLAPFLSRETLEKLVARADPNDLEAIEDIAPFLSKEALDKFVRRCVEAEKLEDIEDLYPFLEKQTLRELARLMIEKQNLDALEDIAPFL